MRYKMIVDVNQEQRDDLIKRFQNAIPNSDNRYRIVLSATETQRLTMLDDLQALPTENSPTPADPVPGECPTCGCKLECDCPCHDDDHHGHGHHGHGRKRRHVYLAGEQIEQS